MSTSRAQSLAASLQQRSAEYDRRLSQIDDELGELNRLAAAAGKRRGDKKPGGDDTQKYRLGSIFSVLSSRFVELDDLALLGLLADAHYTITLLHFSVIDDGASLLDVFNQLLLDPILAQKFRDEGAKLRWEWNRALYVSEVESFAQSKAAQNQRAAWRRKPPTRGQIYLISEAVRAFDFDPPIVSTRGEAFEWLRKVGGNPRFAKKEQS
ncbi:hypothetical protein BRX37_10235 [Sphingomonas sp. S-NIH.Pt3_0716]|nr:hypothetical protein BRX37_10235 [Sphingomonas sp. S-NIH.Pt3_0716]